MYNDTNGAKRALWNSEFFIFRYSIKNYKANSYKFI